MCAVNGTGLPKSIRCLWESAAIPLQSTFSVADSLWIVYMTSVGRQSKSQRKPYADPFASQEGADGNPPHRRV
jgi:hypothetical protein